MTAADRLIGKAHDYEVLAASHSEREALVGGGEHLAAATAFTVARIDTTQVYLKALNRSKAMEAVRDLRWVSGERWEGPYGARTPLLIGRF